MKRFQISRQMFTFANGCHNVISYVCIPFDCSKILSKSIGEEIIFISLLHDKGHPKVRVFLTHGGLMGSSEAAYCGVPVVVTPMYGDQFLNAAALVDRGMGVVVHYEDITYESIKSAIEKSLEPATQANAKQVSFSYKNRPQKPLDTAIWWVEYVAATGGAPLTKSSSTFLPAYIYHSLDIYAVVLPIVLVSLIGWFYVIRRCFGAGRNTKAKVE